MPRWAKSWACSRATGPPPMTISDSGNSSSSMAVVEVRNPLSASPGISGIAGSAPVASR